MDWSSHFPAYVAPEAGTANEGETNRLTKDITVADIGCGFGGLLVALSPLLPDELILGNSTLSVSRPELETNTNK